MAGRSLTPVMLVGAGRLGGALLQGWTASKGILPSDLIILDPHPGHAALAAEQAGALLNPHQDELARACTVLLAVKPQYWRETADALVGGLSPDAVIVSVAAGVRTADLAEAFGGRTVARALPTTAVAVAKGAAAIFASGETGRAAAHRLFDPIATAVDLPVEDLMDAVIGVSGSAPGFFYAFVEALEAAGIAQGLDPEASRRLVRAAIAGAAALMSETGADPADLRAQVASPGGTTQAGLEVLAEGGLGELVEAAVAAAAERARELGR